MTDFQARIVKYLETSSDYMASTWEIAQGAFPEKWNLPSGRGALIGHIDRAGMKAGFIRIPPINQYDDALFGLHQTHINRVKRLLTHPNH